jgi:carbonic anhydrase
MNAALTAPTVQQELRGFEPHELRAVYGVYLVQSHKIWAPTRHSTKDNGLADPPTDLASFIELNAAIVGSDRIASLLST